MRVRCEQICDEYCGHKYVHEWSKECNECDLGLCEPIEKAEPQTENLRELPHYVSALGVNILKL